METGQEMAAKVIKDVEDNLSKTKGNERFFVVMLGILNSLQNILVKLEEIKNRQ